MVKPPYCLVIFVFLLASMAGCGKSAAPTTQVAARVNTDEITLHQINYVLVRSPGISAENAPRAKREILNRLVEQQLARQQAIERKLDRSPDVMQAIEAARTEILARAYFEQIAAAQPKPSPEEALRYYAEHPELFAERRLFMLEEIALAPGQKVAEGLREQLGKSRSMQDVAAWLKGKDVKFTERRGVRAAEQIPLETLPRLQAMKEGQIQDISGAGPAYVVHMLASKAAPVDEAGAVPRIQQFLFNQRSTEAITKEMKQVREKANIEYAGEFAAAPADAEPATKAATADPASPKNPGLEKGIRGLR